MRVWIDGDLCTGVGMCESACPDVFKMAGDGIAHVIDQTGAMLPSGTAAQFNPAILESVLEAAEDCPEECIFIDE